MIKKTLSIFMGIIMSSLICFAQKKEFKFGKISPEEFAIKPIGVDSAASAVKIFDVGDCYFEIKSMAGFVYVFERHVRYKIINKNSYDLANFQIELYAPSGNAKEDLNYMDGATYNMVDGKMVTSKLNKDAKFTEKVDKSNSIKKFTLPNVKEGSIIEFKYKIKSDFIFNIRGWAFQSDIPTLWSEYNVRIPTYFRYKHNTSGYYKISHPVSKSENASYMAGISSDATFDKYVVENSPALKKEPFVTTMSDYTPKIEFELKSTHFPGEIPQDFNSSWPRIINSLAQDENFGGFIKKNSYAKSLLPTIIKGEKDTLAITRSIYAYVKSNLKWNKNYSKYTSESNPKAIFEKKTGSSADINLSLVNFLREAKINAYPMLISTRSNGEHPGYPMISAFNNVVAVMQVNNQIIYLDATDKDMPLGMLDYENLSHQGFFMDLTRIIGQWMPTEPKIPSEQVFVYNFTLDNDNKLKGTINQYSKGYLALQKRDKYRSASNETEYVKAFKKDKTGLDIVKYQIGNLDQLEEFLTESMDAVIEDNVEEAGNLVYLTPLLYERTKENLFKLEERKFPVDFAHPFKESYRITLKFPENYIIDKLPASTIFKIPDNKGLFSITYANEGNMLLVRSTIDVSRSLYSPEDYFDLKELFKAIVEKQAEQIVFKKKAE